MAAASSGPRPPRAASLFPSSVTAAAAAKAAGAGGARAGRPWDLGRVVGGGDLFLLESFWWGLMLLRDAGAGHGRQGLVVSVICGGKEGWERVYINRGQSGPGFGFRTAAAITRNCCWLHLLLLGQRGLVTRSVGYFFFSSAVLLFWLCGMGRAGQVSINIEEENGD